MDNNLSKSSNKQVRNPVSKKKFLGTAWGQHYLKDYIQAKYEPPATGQRSKKGVLTHDKSCPLVKGMEEPANIILEQYLKS